MPLPSVEGSRDGEIMEDVMLMIKVCMTMMILAATGIGLCLAVMLLRDLWGY